MRVVALLLLPGLSLLTLAAHFLRRSELVAVALCLALSGLLFVRRRWAVRVLQGALLFAAWRWLATLAELLPARRAAGEPTARLVAILGSVALLAVVSALLFEAPALRRRFAPPVPPAAG